MKNENKASKKCFTTNDVKRYANQILTNGHLNVADVDIISNKEVMDSVNMIVEAKKFVDDYIAKGGKYISERIREGYIGKEVFTEDGTSYIQSVRGKPFGTLVAIPKGDSISIGYSIVSDIEKYPTPIVGLYLALKRAIEGTKPVTFLNMSTILQIEHFEKRSLAYFHPDVYSYSRGVEGKKVVYRDYDTIHKRQLQILGKEKYEANRLTKKVKEPAKKPVAKKTAPKKKSSTKKA